MCVGGSFVYKLGILEGMSENESSSAGGDTRPRWTLKKRGRSEASATSTTNPSLVEVHEWVQPSHCHQHDDTLRPGHLLRWMDITACLSGGYSNERERERRACCVFDCVKWGLSVCYIDAGNFTGERGREGEGKEGMDGEEG